MKQFLIVVLLGVIFLGAGVTAVGFYRGWFNLGVDGDKSGRTRTPW